jgi:hypothetical protein
MRDSECYSKLDSVTKNLIYFLETNDTSILERSIAYLNQATLCEKTRKSAIEQKIGTMIMMKKYDQAIKFVESLPKQDMGYPFRKDVILKNLYALKAESFTDSISRERFYNEGILNLESYIRRLNPDSDELFAAYYDLFFLKEKILDTATFNKNIDSLIRAKPSMRRYFNSHKLY